MTDMHFFEKERRKRGDRLKKDKTLDFLRNYKSGIIES